MAAVQSSVETITDRLRDLSLQDRSNDWGAKVENLCESFWAVLECENIAIDDVRLFVDLILQEDAFTLARLVIPELRSANAVSTTPNENKQYILERTAYIRARQIADGTKNPADFDTPLYRSEKYIFAQAELFRAKVAFESCRPMTAHEKEEFETWWKSCPLTLSQSDLVDAGTVHCLTLPWRVVQMIEANFCSA